MKYVIKLDNLKNNEYYLGAVGMADDGNKYAFCTNIILATRYDTRAKAEHTMNRLKRTCVNTTNAEIEEVEE